MKGRGNSRLEEPGGWETMPGGGGFIPSPAPPISVCVCVCVYARACACTCACVRVIVPGQGQNGRFQVLKYL